MVSTFARNRYIAIATPFVVFILIHFFLSVFGLPAWSPLSTLTPHWLAAGIGWIQMIVGLGSIYLVGTLGFFIGTFSQKIRA